MIEGECGTEAHGSSDLGGGFGQFEHNKSKDVLLLVTLISVSNSCGLRVCVSTCLRQGRTSLKQDRKV